MHSLSCVFSLSFGERGLVSFVRHIARYAPSSGENLTSKI